MAFSEDELRAIEVVRSFIQEYIDNEGGTVQGLAVNAGVPVATLHRAYNRMYPLKHHYFRSLLNEIKGSEEKTISIMFEIPYYRKYAERQKIYFDCLKNINDPIEKSLINTATFKIALAATFGTTRDEITHEYGARGVSTLNKLIEKKAINISGDGGIMFPDYNIPDLESTIEVAHNIISFLKENSEIIDELKLTIQRVDSDTYKEVTEDIIDTANRISLRMRACNNQGDKKAVFGVFLANIY